MTRPWIPHVVFCAAFSDCARPTDDDMVRDGTGGGWPQASAFSTTPVSSSSDSDGTTSLGPTSSATASGTLATFTIAEETEPTSQSGSETSTGERWTPDFGSILVEGERSRWIGNSFMALQNLHVEAIVSANTSFTIETFPRTPATASADNDYEGWFYGQGLWEMDGAVQAVADEGGYDTCILTSGPWEGGDPGTAEDDAEPLGGTRDFIRALQPWCDRIVLYVTWGHFGMSPTRNPDNYSQGIAEVLRDARRVEAEFPEVVTVPLGLVFYELMTDPPVAVPRADYLHRPGDDPHQNLLGSTIVAWTYYAVVADVSPVGADYDFSAFDPPFVVEDYIGLGDLEEPFPDDVSERLPFDASVRTLFQRRIWDVVQQWRSQTSRFDP